MCFRPLSGHLIFKYSRFLLRKSLASFRPLSGHLIFKLYYNKRICNRSLLSCFRPLSGHLIFKLYLADPMKKIGERFRPLSGHLIFKSCLPEPAILLASLTLLRGKSFSCIFFLYLTYTIASKCSIYAMRGKIFFFLMNCCTHLF